MAEQKQEKQEKEKKETKGQPEKKEEKKEKPLNELLSHTIVDIYIGPDSTHWALHERLLCHHSPFFASIFYDAKAHPRPHQTKSYGLPDEDNTAFSLLVPWLYARTLPGPSSESDLGPLLDLYLLADKLEMSMLASDVVGLVRAFYQRTDTYPGLRRVQYIYSNTSEDNVMREMMVGAIARFLALGDSVPHHWAGALMRNGQLALDIIRSVQLWQLDPEMVPDARVEGRERGRVTKGRFSAVEEEEGKGKEGKGQEEKKEEEEKEEGQSHDGGGNGTSAGTEDETQVNGVDTATTSADGDEVEDGVEDGVENEDEDERKDEGDGEEEEEEAGPEADPDADIDEEEDEPPKDRAEHPASD